MGFLRKLLDSSGVADLQAKFDPLNAKLENIVFGPPSGQSGSFSGGPTGSVAAPPADPLQTLIQPAQMPSQNSAELGQVKRQSLRKQLERRGRLSTILTQSDDTLGA